MVSLILIILIIVVLISHVRFESLFCATSVTRTRDRSFAPKINVAAICKHNIA